MATGEKRFLREVFDKKLRRLCERLDERHQHTISFRHWYFRDRELTVDVTVMSLWVAGSYARGAPDCGDLDVVLQFGPAQDLPPLSTITRIFFGTRPYVSYYMGDPTKNTSGIEFPEAVQIWSGPGCDWASAVDSIKTDATAGRAARETDAIPLRAEQLYSDVDELQSLVEQHAAGLVEWEFIEFDASSLRPIPEYQLTKDEQRLLRFVYRWGRQSKQLLPALMRLMRQREPFGTWEHRLGSQSTISCGGTEVRVGRPSAWIGGAFDSNPSLHQVALVPHISARGPNGALLIRRGPKHPDLATVAGRHAFFLTSNGHPSLISASGEKHHEATVLQLFVTYEEALDEANGWNEDSEELHLEVARAEGSDLLRLFGLCDCVEVDLEDFPINWTGRLYTGKDSTASLETIAAALPNELTLTKAAET